MPRCCRRSGRGSSCRGSTRMTESTRRCAHQDWCTSSSSEMLSTICSTSDWLCAVSTDSTPTMNWKQKRSASTEARGRASTSPIALAFELESAFAAKLGVHPIAEARPTIRLRVSSETPACR